MTLPLFLTATCLASGGNQPLDQVINEATWIVKAKVVEVKEVKTGSQRWGHLQFKIEKIEMLTGDSKDTSLLLNFQAQATAKEVDDGNGEKIRTWYMVPQSGKELGIKKG